MRGTRLLKLAAVTVAVALLIAVLSGCPAAPQPTEEKLMSPEIQPTVPASVKEGENFTVKFKVSATEGKELIYEVAFESQNFKGVVKAGEEVSVSFVAPEELGRLESVEKPIVFTVYYKDNPQVIGVNSSKVKIVKDNAPKVEVLEYPENVLFEQGETSKTVSIKIKVSDPDGDAVDYYVKLGDKVLKSGKVESGTKEGVEETVDVELDLTTFKLYGYRLTLTVGAKDYLKEAESVNVSILASVEYGLNPAEEEEKLGVFSKGSLTAEFTYKPQIEEGVKESSATFYYQIVPADSATPLSGSTGTIEETGLDEKEEVSFEIEIQAATMVNAGAEAGKYYLEVYKASGTDLIGPVRVKFYYYPEVDIETSLSTESDLYGKDATLTFVVSTTTEATVIVESFEDAVSIKLDKYFGGLKGIEISTDSIYQQLDDLYLLKLPATFVISFSVADGVEEDGIAATATFETADGNATEATTSINVDTKKPEIVITNITSNDAGELTITYDATENNPFTGSQVGTMVIYTVDDHTPVATVALERGLNQSTTVQVEGYYDMVYLGYSYEAEDKVGNEVTGGEDETEAFVDNAIGKVAAYWKESNSFKEGYYYNATSLTLVVEIWDNGDKVYPSYIEIATDTSGNIDLVLNEETVDGPKTVDGKWYLKVEYTLTVNTTDGVEQEINTSDATVSIVINNTEKPVIEYNGETLKSTEITLPSSVVLDTKEPEISSIVITSKGELSFDLSEKNLDKITVSATYNNVYKTLVEATTATEMKFDEELFNELFGSTPDGSPVDFEITVVDKAGNSTSTEKSAVVDLVPPKIFYSVENSNLTLDSTLAKFTVWAENGLLREIWLIGDDASMVHVEYELSNGATGTTDSSADSIDEDKSWRFISDPDGFKQATITLTLKDDATPAGTSFEIYAYAFDNTYDQTEKLFTVDYASIYPPKAVVEVGPIITAASSKLVIVKDNSTSYDIVTFTDASKVYEAGVYVVDTSNIEVDDGAGSVDFKGYLVLKTDVGGYTWYFTSASWTPFTGVATKSIEDFVPDAKEIFNSDTVTPDVVVDIGSYYGWSILRAPTITVDLPEAVGLWWTADEFKDAIIHVTMTKAGTSAEMTIGIVFDDGNSVLDSGTYSDFSGWQTPAATVYGYVFDESASEPVAPFFAYRIDTLMDEYAFEATISSAVVYDNAASDGNDLLVATLTVSGRDIDDSAVNNFVIYDLGVSNEVSYDIGSGATDLDITSDTNAADVESGTDVATVTFTLNLGTNTIVSTDTDATVTILKDALKIKIKPADFSSGFWITNFSGDITQ